MIEKSFFNGLGSPIVVATHMRSGTHLTMDFIRRQFPPFRSWKLPGEANDMLYLALDVMSGLQANWGGVTRAADSPEAVPLADQDSLDRPGTGAAA